MINTDVDHSNSLADLAAAEPKQEKYQMLPELSGEQYGALKQDIAERGVLVPVILDEFGAILDGHNRARACRELGINDYPVEVRSGLSEVEKRVFARKINVLRRHLTRDQVRDLIGDQLRETPDWSNNRIAGAIGVDDKTVASVRTDLAATSEIPKLDRLVGSDGRTRPVRQPNRRHHDDIDLDDDDVPRAGRKREKLDEWGGSDAKRAKLFHAADLIELGVDPNSDHVVKLMRESTSWEIRSPAGGYRVFAHCTPEGERDWCLFTLFLIVERWKPEDAAGHVEYLSQKQFMNPDEWLGEEGERWRRLACQNKQPKMGDGVLRSWAAFKEQYRERTQAEIIAEIGGAR